MRHVIELEESNIAQLIAEGLELEPGDRVILRAKSEDIACALKLELDRARATDAGGCVSPRLTHVKLPCA